MCWTKAMAAFWRGKSLQTDEGCHGRDRRGLYGQHRGEDWKDEALCSTDFSLSCHVPPFILASKHWSTIQSYSCSVMGSSEESNEARKTEVTCEQIKQQIQWKLLIQQIFTDFCKTGIQYRAVIWMVELFTINKVGDFPILNRQRNRSIKNKYICWYNVKCFLADTQCVPNALNNK